MTFAKFGNSVCSVVHTAISSARLNQSNPMALYIRAFTAKSFKSTFVRRGLRR